MRKSSDSWRRDHFYNRIVKGVKLAIKQGRLRYLETPIAGHPAKIALPLIEED
jgi:hypothetical protein